MDLLPAPSPARAAVLAAVADEVLRLDPARVRRVAVDGVDGSGKSVFGDELARELTARGASVLRASVDGFHRRRAERYARGRTSPEGFFRDSYDYPALRSRLLDPVGPGGDRRVRTAVFDWRTDTAVDVPPHELEPGDVLLVDGIFLHRDELASSWDLSVWLDVPFDVAYARMAERDGGSADPADPTNARYLEGQRLYLAECDPSARAGLVIDNSDLAAPRLVRGPATSVVRAGRAEVLRTFRWVGGHGDVWAVFRDAQALQAVVHALAEPYRGRVDAVLGIEARGFLLGGAVAVELGVGFVPVRRPGGVFPGPLTSVRTRRDYRGREVELSVQSGALSAGQRVVLVDDWVETGGHARAVAEIARSLGAEVVGVAVVVEQLDESVRAALPPVHAVVTFPELPPYGR